MTQVTFECRSLGYACEWALRAASSQEVFDRVREHARCAHDLPELSPELLGKVEASIHPA